MGRHSKPETPEKPFVLVGELGNRYEIPTNKEIDDAIRMVTCVINTHKNPNVVAALRRDRDNLLDHRTQEKVTTP